MRLKHVAFLTLAVMLITACTVSVSVNGNRVAVDVVSPATSAPTMPPTATPDPTPTREALTPLLVIRQANIRNCPQLTCDVVFVADAGSQLTGVTQVSGATFAGSDVWWALIDGLFIHSVLVEVEG